MEDMMLIRNAIRSIESRPGMFLDKRSLGQLRIFMTGYCYGLDTARPPEDFPHGGEFRAFRDWLLSGQYVNAGTNSAQTHWADIVLAIEKGDDEAAFNRFFVLWAEFLRERPVE
jgi:hypothetical protein